MEPWEAAAALLECLKGVDIDADLSLTTKGEPLLTAYITEEGDSEKVKTKQFKYRNGTWVVV